MHLYQSILHNFQNIEFQKFKLKNYFHRPSGTILKYICSNLMRFVSSQTNLLAREAPSNNFIAYYYVAIFDHG